MYLKQLDLKGFKSFAEQVTLTFDSRLTAIVGPNGGGKSNLTDALRWIMGETNTRLLRQGSLSEVIFSGSKNRAPAQTAYVTATFVKSGWEEKGPPSITITRKIFRNEESVFLLNDKPHRLKDIQELFLDSGLGKGGIAILSEREIDNVLSSDPQPRKSLLEEIAGVTKFLQRKKEAERRMRLVEENLVRLRDIRTAVETELKEAEKQVRKLKKYLEGKDQYRDITQALLCDKIKGELLRKQALLEQQQAAQAVLQQLEAEFSLRKNGSLQLKDQLYKLEEKLGRVKAKLQEQTFLQQMMNREAENLRKKQNRVENELAPITEKIPPLEKQKNQLENRITDLRSRLQTEQEQLRALEDLELKDLLLQKGALQQKVHDLGNAKRDLERDLEYHRKRCREITQELETQQTALEAAQKERAQIAGSRKIQDARHLKTELGQIEGFLWEYLDFPERLSLPLEAALGEALYINLVKDRETIPALLEYLRQNRDLPAAFWGAGEAGFAPPRMEESWLKAPGVEGLLLDQLSCRPAALPLLRALLSDTLLMSDLNAALELQRAIGSAGSTPPPLVTLKGELLSPLGIVIGGREHAALPTCQGELSPAQMKQNHLTGQIEDKKVKIISLTQKSQMLQENTANLERKLSEKAQQLTETQAELERAETVIRESRLTERRQTVKQLRSELEHAQERAGENRRELQLLTQKLTNLQEDFKNAQFAEKALEVKETKSKEDLKAALAQEQELKKEKDSLQREYQELSRREKLFGEQKERENQKLHKYEIELAQLNALLSEQENAARQAGIDLNSVDWENLPSIDRESLQKEQDKWRNFLNQFTEVNLGAKEAHQRLNDRFAELQAEIGDLEKGLVFLGELIVRLEKVSGEKFLETFHQLRAEFSATFKELFSGGYADLVLSQPDRPMEGGFYLTASPPGKKVQNLSALSSGEKALTATAFLFALLKIRPYPFVLLDELDAPLDDANVEKVIRQIEEYAKTSQFIIITHNRRTMEIARRIYGVTMEEPGVSKVVSVKMEESVS